MFDDVGIFLKGIWSKVKIPALVLFIAYYATKKFGQMSMIGGMLPVVFIGFLIGGILIFRNPKSTLYLAVFMGHWVAQLGRYVPGPFGLTIDGLLALGLVFWLWNWDKKYLDRLKTPEFIAIAIWTLYTWLEIVNPISPGPVAWFYAMRGISLYYILTFVVAVGLFKGPNDLRVLFQLMIPLALLSVWMAVRQNAFGMNAAEMRWLMTGPITQHFIRGKMRVFSYMSDASTYGAYASYITTVFGIFAAYTGKMKHRFFYIFLALSSFYGMMLSGSRGPLGIVAFGGMVYLILSKRVALAATGGGLGLGFFVFLKYTTILQGNYNVARLRSALDPNDASLMVRKAKEAILAVYMRDKPIGGGIGSAGMWGERFAPGSFLAETPTDGLYSRIWMETGIIGLYLYLAVFLVLIVMMGYRLWNMPESLFRQRALGLYCGFVGMVGASYVNELITQIPLSLLAYMTPAFIMSERYWREEGVSFEDPPLPEKPPRD